MLHGFSSDKDLYEYMGVSENGGYPQMATLTGNIEHYDNPLGFRVAYFQTIPYDDMMIYVNTCKSSKKIITWQDTDVSKHPDGIIQFCTFCTHTEKWDSHSRSTQLLHVNVNPGLINHGLLIRGGTPPIVISSNTYLWYLPSI